LSHVTVNFVLLVAVPAGLDTLIFPVVAVAGTLTCTVVDVLETIVAETPLKVTEVTYDRFVPVMVTVAPGWPDVGLKLVIVGATPVESKHSAV
jgi:hypothetical protein